MHLTFNVIYEKESDLDLLFLFCCQALADEVGSSHYVPLSPENHPRGHVRLSPIRSTENPPQFHRKYSSLHLQYQFILGLSCLLFIFLVFFHPRLKLRYNNIVFSVGFN